MTVFREGKSVGFLDNEITDRATFIIGENDDIVAALDPLAVSYFQETHMWVGRKKTGLFAKNVTNSAHFQIRTGESATASTSVLTDRANQMEVLYKEASFVE